jgi:cytochrome P450
MGPWNTPTLIKPVRIRQGIAMPDPPQIVAVSDAASPPTPDGLPLLGNGYAFSRDPIAAMETWADEGDVVRLTFPGQEMHMVTAPDLIEEILVSKQERFSIGPAQREFFGGIEDHAVTTNTGDRWRRMRRALHPAFTRERIRGYADTMGETASGVVEEWDDGQAFDLLHEMRLLTVNVLGDALLGVDLRGDEAVVMAAADALIARANFRRPGQFLPDWVPTPTDRRFKRAALRLDDFVADVLADREPGGGGEDVCADLLAAHDRGELSMAEVRHNLVALLLAGHDSPATALTSTMYLLAEHPAVRERFEREVDATLDGHHPTASALEHLDLTRRVVTESLRLYPPTTGVNRQATEPVTLGDYDFEPGARFILPQWVVHRDGRWWDEPDRFDPGRWRGEPDRPEFAYFPFSGGPRACVGNDFARQELVVALATIARHARLAVETDAPLTFAPSIQLRPENELRATVRRR